MQQTITIIFDRIKTVPEHFWVLLVASCTYIIYRRATVREAGLILASSFLLGPFLGNAINHFLVKLDFPNGATSFAYTFAAVLSYNILEHLIMRSPAIADKIFTKVEDKIK